MRTRGPPAARRSIYAARPDTNGHVANAAVGGAPVSSLAPQAKAALQSVPNPELVIVQTIDNDVQCDGTDAENVTTFGATLQADPGVINAAVPESKILLVGQLGRPSTSFIAQLVAKEPSVKGYLCISPGSSARTLRSAARPVTYAWLP